MALLVHTIAILFVKYAKYSKIFIEHTLSSPGTPLCPDMVPPSNACGPLQETYPRLQRKDCCAGDPVMVTSVGAGGGVPSNLGQK